MIKDLQIISPTKAREINEFGEFPTDEYCLDGWRLAESNLKEYTIAGVMVNEIERLELSIGGELEFEEKYVGVKVKCEVNEDNLTAIIL